MGKAAQFRTEIERRKGNREAYQNLADAAKKEIRRLTGEIRKHERALIIVREVGLATQQQLQFHISEITSMALEGVFPEPYELLARFVERRGKTECDLLFARNGMEIDPMTAAGGGASDIAAFALRVASWSMMSPRSRNVLLLDEPFRYLSVDLLPKASEIVREISDKLGLQIIIITHSEELTEDADAVFTVTNRNGKSRVVREGGSNCL